MSLPVDSVSSALQLLRPEAALAATIPAVLLAEIALPAAKQRWVLWIGVLGCAIAMAFAWVGQPGQLAGVLEVDGHATLVRMLVLAITAGVLLVGSGERDGTRQDRGAFATCVLGIALGASVVAMATSLLPLWLGLETVSLSSVALVAFAGGNRRSAEAGMKFVLFSGTASALTLFGISHVYGMTGHFDFAGIAANAAGMPAAMLGALALAGIGLCYKLTLVPFQFYAPDVYEGAPATTLAAVAIAPKVAAVVALARAVQLAVPATVASPAAVGNVLAWIAMASLLVASLSSLVQKDAKRILAFSGIGHAGTAVLALACLPGSAAVTAALFQVFAYALANLGALACLGVIEQDRGSCRLDALRGIANERPWLAGGLGLCLASLAGLPPLAGFFGKWAVLMQSLRFGLDSPDRAPVAMAGLMLVLTTAIYAWAYLLILRAVVLQDPASSPLQPAKVKSEAGSRVVLLACVALVVVAGIWPAARFGL